MKKFEFTASRLGALPVPTKGQSEYRDTKAVGLILRVSHGGSKTFVADSRIKIEGKWQRRAKTLGRVGSLSLADARNACRVFRAEYIAGRDVVAEIRGEKQEREEAPSMRHIIDRYLAEHVTTLANASQRQSTAILIGSKRHREQGGGSPTVIEVFGSEKFRDVRRKDIAAYLDAIIAKGNGHLANRTHGVINHMFKWAIRKSIDETVEHSVADLWEQFKEKPRDRWLADDEITKLLAILDKTVVPDNALVYRLLLVTGQRETEVLTMRWDELDFDKGEWLIPPEKTKSGRTQLVPMSFMFRQLLEGRDQTSEWVFPSPGYKGRYSKSGHRTRNSFANVHPNVVSAAGIKHFRYHDLRRTMATHLGSLGIAEFTVSRVLNHAAKGVTGKHYNFFEYQVEKQHALEAWSYKLMWLMNQKPPQGLIEKLHKWGFGKAWEEHPWTLAQWEVDQKNVINLQKRGSE